MISRVFVSLVSVLASVLVSLWIVLMPVRLLAAQGAAQVTFSFDNITAGLGNAFIQGVLQDAQGFIWVATEDGLYRYDGYDFKHFKHDPTNLHSLSDNYVQRLYIDKKQRLWVSTRNGLDLFDRQKMNFKRYRHQPEQANSLSHNLVIQVTEDSQGMLWIATFGGGINRFDPETEQFTHFGHDDNVSNSLNDDRVYSVLVDHQGVLWVGTRNGGINRFDRKTGGFKHYSHHADQPGSLSHNRVYVLFEDCDGTLWAGTRGGGLARFNRQTDSFEHYRHDPQDSGSLSSDYVWSIFQDRAGSLWIGTVNGLNRFDSERQRFDRYQHDQQNPSSLGNNEVNAIIQDHNGLLWLGTYGGGLSKFDPTSERFGLVQHHSGQPESLSKGYVGAIFKDSDNHLWVGTRSGLDVYQQNTQYEGAGFRHYRHDPNDPNSLSAIGSNGVSAIAEDVEGSIWVGSNYGLSRLNRQNGRFTRYVYQSDNNNSLSDDGVNIIHLDPAGRLWIGTENGLNRFNPQTNDFTRYSYAINGQSRGIHNFINTLYTDNGGALWIGTLVGLNRFDHDKQSFSHYRHDPNDSNSLSHNRVLSVYQDSRGIYWIGTGGGLNRFDITAGVFQHYREKEGLLSDQISAVLGDSQGNLWLGMDDKGLAFFNPNTGEIKNEVGAQAHCRTDFNSYFQADDGQLFFGRDGYCAFYPERAIIASEPPVLVFTDFRLLNQSVAISADGDEQEKTVLTRAINQTESITLGHADNVLSFEFAALHYSDPKSNQYQYKLEGFNLDWITTGADNRRATFTNLAAGQYTFMVRASNNEGVWSTHTRAIKLTVLPAPWRTWWAYLIYLLCFGLAVGSWNFQRAQRREALILAKNNAELAKTNAEKARENAEKANQAKSLFIANVSHEIRTPLNAVLGYSAMLEQDSSLVGEQRSKLNIIAKSGHQLLGLINDILDISKIEVNATVLVGKDFELVDLLDDIGLMLAGRCDEKGLGWQLNNHCGERVPVYGDQGKLRQILVNLLGNAVKFTRDGSISLSVCATAVNYYRFEVADTGVGIAAAQLAEIFKPFGQTDEGLKHGGTGLGLAIAQKQVTLMGGRLQVETTPDKGSRFFFTLPLMPAKAEVKSRPSRVLPEVEFNYQSESVLTPENETMASLSSTADFDTLCIPKGLYDALYNAADNYEVSKLTACLSELSSMDKQAQEFAEHLRQHLSRYDMEGILADLTKVEQC